VEKKGIKRARQSELALVADEKQESGLQLPLKKNGGGGRPDGRRRPARFLLNIMRFFRKPPLNLSLNIQWIEK
jgi:hypothetical protein